MTPFNVLLVDSDDYSASVLAGALRDAGAARVAHVGPGLGVPAAMTRERPDLVVFNHHFDRPDDLLSCATAKLAQPDAVVLAIAAAGPALRAVRAWRADTGYIDAVLQKPLGAGDILGAAGELLHNRQVARGLRDQAERLANLLPDGALSALQGEGDGQEELFEAAVLFTDVRRSSDLITRTAPREFFQQLNRTLGAQARTIRAFDGEVVKYTGDGLMAVFRGMGRSHLALRCALDLGARADGRDGMPFGIGVAQGLVLAGLVGADGPGQRRQYDVIGATVHLAARLCALAGAGEVMTTQSTYTAARLGAQPVRPIGAVAVRGFPQPIECVAFDRQPLRQEA